MLRYEFDYLKDGVVSYSYHLENKQEYTGYVRVSIETGEAIEIILSGYPYECDSYKYASKPCGRIRDFIETGEFQQVGIVAWY